VLITDIPITARQNVAKNELCGKQHKQESFATPPAKPPSIPAQFSVRDRAHLCQSFNDGSLEQTIAHRAWGQHTTRSKGSPCRRRCFTEFCSTSRHPRGNRARAIISRLLWCTLLLSLCTWPGRLPGMNDTPYKVSSRLCFAILRFHGGVYTTLDAVAHVAVRRMGRLSTTAIVAAHDDCLGGAQSVNLRGQDIQYRVHT
jgi:hypothetical protein